MRRRDLAIAFGGAALSWPLSARAQQLALPVVGFLNSRSAADTSRLLAGFRDGLRRGGIVEGQNVVIQYRWADGAYNRLPEMAVELTRAPVALLVATGGEPVALAAQAATKSIPIIFVVGGNPVTLGLVASYPRPGGNLTGISIVTSELAAKRLGLMHDLVPDTAIIGLLLNPQFPTSEAQLKDTRAAAATLRVEIGVFRAGTAAEIDAAFATIVKQRIAALIVAADPFFDTRRGQLVALAAHHAIPTMYQSREYTAAGGLMSYGIDLVDVYRQVGIYASRILNGSSPAELPIMEQSKFELVINRNSAHALRLDVPAVLLAQADEIIE